MDRWAEKVAVVTGASSGIGLEISKALVRHGLIVVGLARRKLKMQNEMNQVEGEGKFYALECDIADEKQVNNAFEWIKKNLNTVHILINNAGILKFDTIAHLEMSELKEIMDINFNGSLLCSKLASSMMTEGKHESHIIMINSVLGHRISYGSPAFSSNIYAPTKFALKALARMLEIELQDENIRVSNIYPGAVKTDMMAKIPIDPIALQNMDCLDPKDIANAVIYVLGAPPKVLIEELIIKPLHATY